jgi:hypothetical protein
MEGADSIFHGLVSGGLVLGAWVFGSLVLGVG